MTARLPEGGHSHRLCYIFISASIFLLCLLGCEGDEPVEPIPGPQWEELGAGLPGPITEATTIGGNLWVCGYYYSDTWTDAIGFVARLEANGWVPVGGDVGEQMIVEKLIEWRGDVVGCGYPRMGSHTGGSVVSIQDDEWTALSDSLYREAWTMATYEGSLIVGGYFDRMSFRNVWRFDGGTWEPMDQLAGAVLDLQILQGELVAGGIFSIRGRELGLAVWDDAQWQPIGDGVRGMPLCGVYSMTIYNGELVIGGSFLRAGEVSTNNIAAWDGSSWNTLGSGTDGHIMALAVWNGNLVAAGGFWHAGSAVANGIAYWNGSSWLALGAGANERVTNLAVLDGCCIAGGRFTQMDGKGVRRIAGLCTPPED